MVRFETFDRMKWNGHKWFFRIVSEGNNEILAQSEAYNSARARDHAVGLIGATADKALICDGNKR